MIVKAKYKVVKLITKKKIAFKFLDCFTELVLADVFVYSLMTNKFILF